MESNGESHQYATRKKNKPVRPADDTSLKDWYGFPKKFQPLWRVNDRIEVFKGKYGRGLRTRRAHILQGEILMREVAFMNRIAINDDDDNSDMDEQIIKAHLTRLKEAGSNTDSSHEERVQRRQNLQQLHRFIALSYPKGDDSEKGRYFRNCFGGQGVNIEALPGQGNKKRRQSNESDADAEDDRPADSYCYMWLQLAMANHSCRPNAIVHFNQTEDAPEAQLIASVDMPESGTEIFINYVGDDGPTDDNILLGHRQEYLSHWDFICSCTACEGEDDDADGSLSPLSNVWDLYERVKAGGNLNKLRAEERQRRLLARGIDDDRTEILKLANILRLGPSDDESSEYPTIEDIQTHFSRYERLLIQENMTARLMYAHYRILDAYRARWDPLADIPDESTRARVLHHREQYTRYLRVLYGPEHNETLKSAKAYARELDGNITKPFRRRVASKSEPNPLKRIDGQTDKNRNRCRGEEKRRRLEKRFRSESPLQSTLSDDNPGRDDRCDVETRSKRLKRAHVVKSTARMKAVKDKKSLSAMKDKQEEEQDERDEERGEILSSYSDPRTFPASQNQPRLTKGSAKGSLAPPSRSHDAQGTKKMSLCKKRETTSTASTCSPQCLQTSPGRDDDGAGTSPPPKVLKNVKVLEEKGKDAVVSKSKMKKKKKRMTKRMLGFIDLTVDSD